MSILANDKISGVFEAQLKQNNFLALFFSLFISILLFIMYYYIFKNIGFKDFVQTFDFIFGKIIGRFILLLYAIYFLFIAMLDTRDIVQFINTFLLDKAPLVFIRLMYLFVIYYVLINGLEVMARVAQILFNVVFFIFVTFSILILASNELHIENFFPMLEYGIKPLVMPTLLMSVSIPFGEFFILMMIFQHLSEKNKLLRVGLIAQLLSGFIIITVFFLNLIVLSPETLVYMLSPALRISRRIDIEGFFQRFDLITLLILVMLSYIKTGLLIYGGKHCISHVFNIKKDALLYGIIFIAVLVGSIYYFPDYILLLKESGKYVMPIINPTFEFLIPFLLFIISFFKKGKAKKEKQEEQSPVKEKTKKEMIKEKFFTLFNK